MSSSASGAFDGACTLAPAAANASSCTVAYTPSASGSHQITAAYGGDANHDGSQGATTLEVTAPPTGSGATPGTGVDCSALRKKLRKAKRAHNAPLVRKLKKKLRKLGC
jgi:hypothetical protein